MTTRAQGRMSCRQRARQALAQPCKPRFQLTHFSITFLGLLAALASTPTPLLAEDLYKNVTPLNIRDGAWYTYLINSDYVTEEENVYFGARGGSNYYDIVKIGTPTTHLVKGKRIHIFSRPGTVSTQYNSLLEFSLHTTEADTHRENTVTWDAELIVDGESSTTHANYYPLTQGIATGNYEASYFPGHTAHTNVTFLKPVSIRVNNNSDLDSNQQPNSVIALGIKDMKNKASHLTFEDTVTGNSTSGKARPTTGIAMESAYADTGSGMPTLHFKKNASFKAQTTGGNDALGAKFYVTGWKDSELNLGNSALSHFSETDIDAIRDRVYQQKLITDAGSTLTLEAIVDRSEQAVEGSATGLNTFAYPHSEQIFELGGKLVVKAKSDQQSTATGIIHNVIDGAFHANYRGGLEVEATALNTSSWGIFSDIKSGTLVTNATGETKVAAHGKYSTYAFKMQTAKAEDDADNNRAVELDTHYAATTLTAQSSDAFARAIDMRLKNTTAKLEFDELHASATGAEASRSDTYGMYFYAQAKTKSEQTIKKLTLSSTGNGLYQAAAGDSQATMTVQDADFSGVYGFAVSAYSAGADNQSHIRLEKHLTLVENGAFASGSGKGAWIETDLSQATLSGMVNMRNGARFTLGLKSAQAQATLNLNNALTPQSPAIIDVKLADNALWRAIGEPSKINEITFSNHGRLDLRQVEASTPEPAARLRRALPDDRNAPSTPAAIPASITMDRLLGNDGWISLTVNTSTNEGQVLEITERSEGLHTLDIHNQSGEHATGMPILLVRSVNGLTNPENYQARFVEARPIEVGELKYYVGNSTMVNEEADTSSHPERAVNDTNEDNWYLYPANRPDTSLPNLTDTAKGAIGASAANYLLALQSAETLRERLGDIHTFAPRDNQWSAWTKVSATNWRMAPRLADSTWDMDLRHVKVGADRALGERSRFGGFFGYTDFSSQHQAPAKFKGRAMEGGLYWTTLTANRLYTDVVARLGRIENEFDSKDTQGEAVKTEDLHNHYVALSLNVGKQISLTERWVLEPMGYVGYTRFGEFTSQSDNGLHAKTDGYNSLITMLGSTMEWRSVTAQGNPWTLYAKAFWEKEWLAKNAVTFNATNTYDVNLKTSRLVYGLGIEGTLGKASTWHADLERSTGSVLREDWQVNAGLRIPF